MWSRPNKIGLESIRVRNCDPGADNRMPIDRASLCRKNEPELRCSPQRVAVPSPRRLFATTHECAQRSSFFHGVEHLEGRAQLVASVTNNCPHPTDCSAPSSKIDWSLSWSLVCSDVRPCQQAIHPIGWVCAPGRNTPPFVFLTPLNVQASWTEKQEQSGSHAPDASRDGFFDVAQTDSRSGLRTHSLLRVSDEKRNADECAAARGKPSCHR